MGPALGVQLTARVPGWRGRMQAFLAEVGRREFAWDGADCAVAFVGEHVHSMLGQDLAAPYRGKFGDAFGALRTIRAAGYADLPSLVSSLLPAIPPSAAATADILGMPDPDSPIGFALGICSRDRILVLKERGYGSLDRCVASHAWRVGDA